MDVLTTGFMELSMMQTLLAEVTPLSPSWYASPVDCPKDSCLSTNSSAHSARHYSSHISHT